MKEMLDTVAAVTCSYGCAVIQNAAELVLETRVLAPCVRVCDRVSVTESLRACVCRPPHAAPPLI